MSSLPADAWFCNAVINGLTKIVINYPPGTPSEEIIELTRENWIEDLWTMPLAWNKELDAERLTKAFADLRRAMKWWPQMSELIALLEERKKPVVLGLPAPPERVWTPEELAANKARISKLLRDAKQNAINKAAEVKQKQEDDRRKRHEEHNQRLKEAEMALKSLS
jgi:hypothetical protein